MLLSNVVLVLFAALAIMAMTMRIASLRMHPQAAGEWVSTNLSSLLIIAFLGLMALRSTGFGVDTAAYLDTYRLYCSRGNVDTDELSFLASAVIINAGMLGTCEPVLLPAVWAGFIAAMLLSMALPWRLRLQYTALFCISIVGVELATNALRQGMSVAVLMLAISLWPRVRVLSLALAAAAVVLHPSSALTIVSLALTAASWPRFIALLVLSLGGVWFAIENGLQVALLEPFLFEVQKYLAHEGDEIYVRMLSFAGVLLALAAPFACRTGHASRHDILRERSYATALKLGFTCLPFLALPYFGYRYIYAVYPIVLFFTLQASSRRSLQGRMFAVLALGNTAILFVWSRGSSYMQDVPFF